MKSITALLFVLRSNCYVRQCIYKLLVSIMSAAFSVNSFSFICWTCTCHCNLDSYPHGTFKLEITFSKNVTKGSTVMSQGIQKLLYVGCFQTPFSSELLTSSWKIVMTSRLSICWFGRVKVNFCLCVPWGMWGCGDIASLILSVCARWRCRK